MKANLGVPMVTVEEGEKHRTAAGALAFRLTNRKRALIEQALDELMREAGKGGDRDPVAALAATYFDDPQAWLSWLDRLLPREQAPSSAPGGLGNVAAMFLQATQQVNASGDALRVVNAAVIPAGTTRVQHDVSDW